MDTITSPEVLFQSDTEVLNEVLSATMAELDSEINDGLTRTLFWDRLTDRCWVRVEDSKNGDDSLFPVPEGKSPYSVFRHACAYL